MSYPPPVDRSGPEGAFLGFSDAQLGVVAEDRVSTAILLSSEGETGVAFPLLDQGFDLYPRRTRTLNVRPVQVKARSFLSPSGEFQVSVGSLHPDPNSAIVMPYIPPPDYQLAPLLWAISTPDFLKLTRRNQDGSLLFAGYLDRRFDSPFNKFLVESDRLQRRWLDLTPGWKNPVRVPPMPAAHHSGTGVERAAARAFGKHGELWLASQIMRAGLQDIVVAQDRLRVDCVDLLLHDLTGYRVGGLLVHTSTISTRGTVQFRIRHRTFFIDPRLFVIVLPCRDGGTFHDTSFVIPSEAIPSITTASSDRGDGGYQGNFRLDPLPERMMPFARPTATIGDVVLKTIFPGS